MSFYVSLTFVYPALSLCPRQTFSFQRIQIWFKNNNSYSTHRFNFQNLIEYWFFNATLVQFIPGKHFPCALELISRVRVLGFFFRRRNELSTLLYVVFLSFDAAALITAWIKHPLIMMSHPHRFSVWNFPHSFSDLFSESVDSQVTVLKCHRGIILSNN